MATLADELLNDFEDEELEEVEDQSNETFDKDGITLLQGGAAKPGANGTEDGMELDGDEEEVQEDDDLMDGATVNKAMADAEDEDEAKARVEKMQLGGISDVRSVASLMKTLQPVLNSISHYQNLPSEKRTNKADLGSIEDDPEYQLLTKSNTLSTSIDGEIILVHKFIRDHYSVRFPELETLISNPLDYAKTVAIIGNGPMEDVKSLSNSEDNLVGQPLRRVLDGPSLMNVSVEATTTRGQALSEAELETVRRACAMVLQLDRAKKTLTDYVQSRMNLFAPNLTELIGSLTAAQLLNFAGGLTGLAKTPACNIPPLGSKKQAQTGFATNVGIRHQGFLYHSPLIKGIPADLKKQALRIVSAKVILAARVDRVHSAPDGSTGAELKAACLERLEKLTEPPPNKGPRALPVPDDKPSRKRGGRRARKAKDATAMTELRKAQNRVAFAAPEAEAGYGTSDSTRGLGMLGQETAGPVRRAVVDQRTRARLSKKNAGWAAAGAATAGTASSLRAAGGATSLKSLGLRAAGVGSLPGAGAAAAGTASSIAFTPVQGLELVDPKVRAERERKMKAEDDRWFKSGTFTQVGGAATAVPGGGGGGGGVAHAAGSVAPGGFKVPALPAKRKSEALEGK